MDNQILQKEISIPEDVFAQEIDGEMGLFDREREVYFGLDEVGSDIWYAIDQYGTIAKILSFLEKMYDVEEAVLQKDLLDFVAKLEENGLIKVEAF
jgi:hypothetical protein